MTPNLAPSLLLLTVFILPSLARSENPPQRAVRKDWYALRSPDALKPMTFDLCGGGPVLFSHSDLIKASGRVDVRKPHNVDLYCAKVGAEPGKIDAAKLWYCFESIDCRGTYSRRRGLYLAGKGVGAPELVGYRYAWADELKPTPLPVKPPAVPIAPAKPPAVPIEPAKPPAIPVEPDVSAVTSLTAQELRWLSRAEKRAYEAAKTAAESAANDKNAALKRVVEDFRAKVKANLRHKALPDYEKALTVAKTTSAIDAALKPVKMWGGTVTAPVALSGANEEIQLTHAEYAALEKKRAAHEKYNDDRSDINGGKEDEPFNQSFDPIALHQVTEAARKAIGGAAGPGAAPGPGGTPAAAKPQFEAEAKNQSTQFAPYMTEEELTAYKAGLHGKTGAALLEYNKEQLKKIAGRTPYPKDDQAFTEAQFDALEGWKQKRYCEGFRKRPPPPPTQNKTPAANSKTALTTLKTCEKEGGECKQLESNKTGSENIVDASGGADGWANRRCKALDPTAGNEKPAVKTETKAPPPVVGGKGSADETKAAEPNPWLAKPLIYSAVKGALVGALVGSLFGPGGAILGALVGAAIFYGVSKWTE